jgi:hypothetical protein
MYIFHYLGDSRRDGGESPATIVPLDLPLTQKMVLLSTVFRASFQTVHTKLANGGHTANNCCIQWASRKHSTTWWSAQRIISAHSAHTAYGTPSALHVHRSPCTSDVTSVTVHCNVQCNSWTAIYTSLTITIINYKSVMYQSTGNKQLQQPLPNCRAADCTFQQPVFFYYYSVLPTPVSDCKHRRKVSWRTVQVNKLRICRVQW